MAGTNKFIQWDSNGTNMYSDTTYAAQTAITDGVSVGEIADPDLHNKLFYQMSTMCAAWGQVFADLGYDVNDSSLTSLTTILKNIIVNDNMWSLFTGDFHSKTTNGFYSTTSVGQTNAPNGTDKFYLIVAKNGTSIYHLAMSVVTGTNFYNVYNGSTWSGWSTVATVEQLQNYSFTIKTSDIISKGPLVDVRAFGAVGDGNDDPQLFANAVNSLPVEGGTIFLPVGRWRTPHTTTSTYLSKKNVRIIGAKIPTYNNDFTALTGGSVIIGPLMVFADNFEISNVGIDSGSTVCTNYYSGVAKDGFIHFQPNQVSPTYAQNLVARDVITLCAKADSMYHSFLLEAVDGAYLDNITSCYGIHGIVIKSINVNAGTLTCYASGSNPLILKSDSYSCGANININTVCIVPKISTVGVSLDCAVRFHGATFTLAHINIGKIIIDSSNYPSKFGIGILFNGTDSYYVTDVNIGSVIIDSVNNFGIVEEGNLCRIHVSKCTINNAPTPILVYGAITQSQLSIGEIATASSSAGVCLAQLSGGAILHINKVLSLSTLSSGLWNIDNTSRLFIGHCYDANSNTVFINSQPALLNSWVNFGSPNALFKVYLEDNKLKLKGLIHNGTTTTITTLPQYIRPLESYRVPIVANNGTTAALVCLLVGSDGTVAIEGATPATYSEFVDINATIPLI